MGASMERSNAFFYQNVASCERDPLVLSAGAAQRIETVCYFGTIVDSLTWRQAKYPAPGRQFGRPGGHAEMRPRRGLLKLLRTLAPCQ